MNIKQLVEQMGATVRATLNESLAAFERRIAALEKVDTFAVLPCPERGEKGEKGEAGKDGEPGRDALTIDILPAIDQARSYARGTYASHRGGVVRAARTTDYLDTLKDGETVETKGWQIVLAGLAEQSIEQVDDRTFVMRQVDTAGRVTEKRATLPVMIYRQIWREGQYERGDTVTWGGSLWHCEETTREKPGTGKGWKLAVKRGADGKDKG